MDFSDAQMHRYARHLVLPEIGDEGQAKLLQSKVLVIGAGGLGSPLLLYLAAAGVGRIGVVDDDTVDLSNLQRQIVHDTSNIDLPKVESAKQRLAEINPEVELIPHPCRIGADNALELFAQYDLIADGSDNFPTRYLVNDACYLAGRPLVSAAILRFDGQLATFKAHENAGSEKELPCYRCLFGEQPPDTRDSCADVGVLGALAGVMGSLQAIEIIKELLGIGESLAGFLMLYDALRSNFQKIAIKADPGCPLCGPQATIKDLSKVDYRLGEAVCVT